MRRTWIIPIVILCASGLAVGGFPQAQVSSDDSPKDLVFIGTVTKLYQTGFRYSRREWAVQTHVEKVVSGKFPGTMFTFTVHSPAMAGLRVGRAYTIKATWTRDGYVVNQSTFKEARSPTKASRENLDALPTRNITYSLQRTRFARR